MADKKRKYTRNAGADIALYALKQNEDALKSRFPNIASVSDSVTRVNSVLTNVVAIYLKDDNTTGIPAELEVEMPDGTTQKIPTEITTGLGDAKVHFSQANNVSNSQTPGFLGSICCAVKSTTDQDFLGVITSAHIYTGGNYQVLNGVLDPPAGIPLINGQQLGAWQLGILNVFQDMALIKVNNGQAPDQNYMCFYNRYHTVTQPDVQTDAPNITIISKDNNRRDAYILDYNVGMSVGYSNGEQYKRNIILTGSTNSKQTCSTVSAEGDSGSCVFLKGTNKLVGMLLGGNDKFSFVLPVQDTLTMFNLITV